MPMSRQFFSNPSLGQAYGAALLAFFAGLPITNGSWSLIGYFHIFIFFFTFSSLWLFRKQSPSLLTELKLRSPWAFYLLLAWCVLVSLSLLRVLLFTDISAFHVFAATQRYLHDAFTLAFVFALAKLYRLEYIRLSQIITALSLGMFAMMLLQFYTYQLQLVPSLTWFATPPLAPHMRDLGNMACVCIVGISGLLLNKKSYSKLHASYLALALLANWGFLIWSGGRMGIAAATISCIILLAYFLAYQKTPWQKVILVCTLSIAGAYAGNQLAVFDWNGIGRTASLSQQAQNTLSDGINKESHSAFNKANQLTTGRAQMWTMSLRAMSASPWLGLGPFGYFFIPERNYDDQPHNFIVQFLVEWGVLGTAAMLALLLLCAKQALTQLPAQIKQANEQYIVAVGVVLVLSIHGLTGGTYFKIQPLICLAIAFAAMLNLANKSKPQSP